MKEEQFPYPGNLLLWLGAQPGQIGGCRGLEFAQEECAQAGLLPSRIERNRH